MKAWNVSKGRPNLNPYSSDPNQIISAPAAAHPALVQSLIGAERVLTDLGDPIYKAPCWPQPTHSYTGLPLNDSVIVDTCDCDELCTTSVYCVSSVYLVFTWRDVVSALGNISVNKPDLARFDRPNTCCSFIYGTLALKQFHVVRFGLICRHETLLWGLGMTTQL